MSLRFRFALVAGAVALLALSYAVAQKDPKVPEEALYAPTLTPDRVILTFAGDPATSAAVTWRTATNVQNPIAQLAIAGDGLDFVKSAQQFSATTETLKSDINEAAYHNVRFTSLKPSTVYAYRVGDGFNFSEWNQFKTAATTPDPISFLYVGDAQTDIYSLWSRVIRTGFAEASKANFIIHAGDLTNRAARDIEWGQWHTAPGWINRSIPQVPTPGNHEYSGLLAGKKTLTTHWRPQFTHPENGIKGLEETSYYFDIQGVRVVVLNSNEHQTEQAAWLDANLSNNPNRWTVLTFHHPIFSSAKGRDNKELRESWQPIFDKHHVDLVLTGHDHTYARTNITSGVNKRTDSGTVYVVSVSGSKMYNLEREPWMQRAAEDTQLFQVIRIDGDTLTFEARTATGALYDAFELHKKAGSANQIVNKPLPTPERLRGKQATPSAGD